jgi:predicted DNA-binding transcriptional regulator AlpA
MNESVSARTELPDRLAYRPAEAARACGVSRSTFYDWLNRGLAPRPIHAREGGATLILASSLRRWLEASERAGRLLTQDEFSAIAEATK